MMYLLIEDGNVPLVSYTDEHGELRTGERAVYYYWERSLKDGYTMVFIKNNNFPRHAWLYRPDEVAAAYGRFTRLLLEGAEGISMFSAGNLIQMPPWKIDQRTWVLVQQKEMLDYMDRLKQ